MAAVTLNVMYKKASGSTLGIIWRKIILTEDAPATREASIKGLDFNDRVWDRITRDTAGHLKMAMIKTISQILNWPNKDARISRMTREGMTMMISAMRMRKASTQPPA